MRIGFDVSQTGKRKAGCGYWAYSLIKELAEIDDRNEYILYRAVGDLFWDPECATETFQTDRPNFKSAPAPASQTQARQFWSHPPADFEGQLGHPDIFHSNNFYCPTGLQRARLVYTLYDLSFLEEPSWTTEENRVGCFNGVFRASLFADFIIAISQHSRRHFLEVFPHFPADRIEVIYPASRFEAQASSLRPEIARAIAPGKFWLNVATLEPRKNHSRLLAAYASLVSEGLDSMPLVLVGSSGWLVQDLDREIQRMGLGQQVVWAGYVTDDELKWLYQNCFAFVYPSLFEGFGLPVLEAMSLGAPVVCSNVSSLPEIVSDAALLADPLDVAALASQMKRLATGEVNRERLREQGLARAKGFSWRRSAQKLLELYERTLNLPQRGTQRIPLRAEALTAYEKLRSLPPRE